MTATASAIRLDGVRFCWPGRVGFGLDVPRFVVERGETVLLLGESGSGKSTLLSLICGIVAAAEGRVEVDGTDLGALGSGARDRFRAETIGVIFQQFNLLPYARVSDNILLPLRFAPKRRARVADALAEATHLCKTLGLPEGLASAPAAQLSVGQQQRVAAARALIGAPPVIVADEPASALDAETQEAFLATLFAQVREAGTTLLMVSHDARLGARFDRVIRLSDIAQPVTEPA